MLIHNNVLLVKIGLGRWLIYHLSSWPLAKKSLVQWEKGHQPAWHFKLIRSGKHAAEVGSSLIILTADFKVRHFFSTCFLGVFGCPMPHPAQGKKNMTKFQLRQHLGQICGRPSGSRGILPRVGPKNRHPPVFLEIFDQMSVQNPCWLRISLSTFHILGIKDHPIEESNVQHGIPI